MFGQKRRDEVEDVDIRVELQCACGRRYGMGVSSGIWNDEALRASIIAGACCPECLARIKQDDRQHELQMDRAERQVELDKSFGRRLSDSNLERYRMSYDPLHEGANPELFEFVRANIDRSIWAAGHTGLCKTRIIQHFAMEALKTRTVLYWPCCDLMNYLSTHSLKIDTIMQAILTVDLLILDDVGKETATMAKMKYLFNIVDRRYNAWDQLKRINNGSLNPLWIRRKERSLGAQIWFTTQDDGSGVNENMGPVDGPAFIRRLQEMSAVWEKF